MSAHVQQALQAISGWMSSGGGDAETSTLLPATGPEAKDSDDDAEDEGTPGLPVIASLAAATGGATPTAAAAAGEPPGTVGQEMTCSACGHQLPYGRHYLCLSCDGIKVCNACGPSHDQSHGLTTFSVRATHPGILCSKCGANVVGLRMVCLTCTAFNLCEACSVEAAHEHPLLLVAQPADVPPRLTTVGNAALACATKTLQSSACFEDSSDIVWTELWFWHFTIPFVSTEYKITG